METNVRLTSNESVRIYLSERKHLTVGLGNSLQLVLLLDSVRVR